MTESQSADDVEKQHGEDIFREGDEVPWHGEWATITSRELRDEFPEEVEDHQQPGGFTDVEGDEDAQYVLLTVERADGDEVHALATWLTRHLSAHFDSHGLPGVRADLTSGLATTGATRVQTPATGNNHLDREQTMELAEFIKEHKDFEPLYALLGGTESAEDMEALADALDRAAKVREYTERYQTEDDE